MILSGPNKKTDGCDGESIEKNDCNNNECFEFPCCQYVTIKTNSKSFDYRTGLYKIVNEIVDDRYIYKQESGASIIFSTRKNVRFFTFSQFKILNFFSTGWSVMIPQKKAATRTLKVVTSVPLNQADGMNGMG